MATNKIDRPRNHFDSTGRGRVLRENGSRHDERDEHADDEPKFVDHMKVYRSKPGTASGRLRTAWIGTPAKTVSVSRRRDAAGQVDRSCLSPQLAARERGAVDQSFELRPRDLRMDAQ